MEDTSWVVPNCFAWPLEHSDIALELAMEPLHVGKIIDKK